MLNHNGFPDIEFSHSSTVNIMTYRILGYFAFHKSQWPGVPRGSGTAREPNFICWNVYLIQGTGDTKPIIVNYKHLHLSLHHGVIMINKYSPWESHPGFSTTNLCKMISFCSVTILRFFIQNLYDVFTPKWSSCEKNRQENIITWPMLVVNTTSVA